MARKGDRVTVVWQDAEHSEDVELDRDWSKYKLVVHKTEGIIGHNGKKILVIISSKEANSTHGDVYAIPKDKWIVDIIVHKTKGQLQKGE